MIPSDPNLPKAAEAGIDGPPRKVYAVAELTRRIKTTLESRIGRVWIEGEVSNFTQSQAGHTYFTLKDAEAQMAAVWFKGAQEAGSSIRIRDGDQLRVEGDITVYAQRGNYQVLVRRVEPAGRGSLLREFEERKKRLAAEGLFDDSRKRPLPVLPHHVGLVTSPTGAAVRDILQVLERRFPNLHVVIAPVRVQGDRAADMIARAIEYFNRRGEMDLLIVGRGGGSLEDLWAFNEEVVARAVASSTIPIISAVGHETDFTICDFAADLRAPTPSAAAELAVGRKADFLDQLDARRRRLVRALENRLLFDRNRLTRTGGSYVFKEPGHLLRHHRQSVRNLGQGLGHHARNHCRRHQQRVDELNSRLPRRVQAASARTRDLLTRLRVALAAQSPAVRIGTDRQRLTAATARLRHGMARGLTHYRHQVQQRDAQLRALGPQAVLDRGFSITRTPDGTLIRTAGDVRPGARLETLLGRGALTSTVDEVHRSDHEQEP